MKEFFPENAVEYFVSYYDYYQPEAYIPSSDTYIEKDSSINDEIDKLRLSATTSLSERRDVISWHRSHAYTALVLPPTIRTCAYRSVLVRARTGTRSFMS